jgi:xanthine/uracil/vitamin C permease (AzgA family)
VFAQLPSNCVLKQEKEIPKTRFMREIRAGITTFFTMFVLLSPALLSPRSLTEFF